MRLAMGQLDGILSVCQMMHNHHTQLGKDQTTLHIPWFLNHLP